MTSRQVRDKTRSTKSTIQVVPISIWDIKIKWITKIIFSKTFFLCFWGQGHIYKKEKSNNKLSNCAFMALSKGYMMFYRCKCLVLYWKSISDQQGPNTVVPYLMWWLLLMNTDREHPGSGAAEPIVDWPEKRWTPHPRSSGGKNWSHCQICPVISESATDVTIEGQRPESEVDTVGYNCVHVREYISRNEIFSTYLLNQSKQI